MTEPADSASSGTAFSAPASNDTGSSGTALARAAALFTAAARNEHAGPAAQLHCLAAATGLDAPVEPVPTAIDAVDPDRLIERALRILGELPVEEFSDPDVLAAARHGRRALREPR